MKMEFIDREADFDDSEKVFVGFRGQGIHFLHSRDDPSNRGG